MDVKIKNIDLSKQAIDSALSGEWAEASKINRKILADKPESIEALNRLAKSLMELGEISECRDILCKVLGLSPSNNIAKKNLLRLDELEYASSEKRPPKQTAVNYGSFIEDSSKSATVKLENCPTGLALARFAPGDKVYLKCQNSSIEVYLHEDHFIGIVDRRIGRRLTKLISGGNIYDATLVGINEGLISILIRETYRSPSLCNVSSFPNKVSTDNRMQFREGLLRSVAGTDFDDGERGALEPAFDESEWDE